MTSEVVGEHLREWEQARMACLSHLTFQVIECQLRPVEEALDAAGTGEVMRRGRKGLPGAYSNGRGNALVAICGGLS